MLIRSIHLGNRALKAFHEDPESDMEENAISMRKSPSLFERLTGRSTKF